MKIIDCFTFSTELDLLDLRLNILKDLVDYFVIVEADKTFSGKLKDSVFANNIERFSPFFDKIIYIHKKLTAENAWARETEQRNAIAEGLSKIEGLNGMDYIMMSDVDEIPNPQAIKENLDGGESQIVPYPLVMVQKMYYGHLNSFCFTDPNWLGTICCRQNLIEQFKFSFQQLRDLRGRLPKISNGGWHFSWMGGVDRIIDKIQSYSHQEFNTDWYTNPSRIEAALTSNRDILGRSNFKYVIEEVNDENEFPTYLIDNIEKYKNLILI